VSDPEIALGVLRVEIRRLRAEVARLSYLLDRAEACGSGLGWERAELRARMSAVDAVLENAVMRCGRVAARLDDAC
jgi:hypothetical protein